MVAAGKFEKDELFVPESYTLPLSDGSIDPTIHPWDNFDLTRCFSFRSFRKTITIRIKPKNFSGGGGGAAAEEVVEEEEEEEEAEAPAGGGGLFGDDGDGGDY